MLKVGDLILVRLRTKGNNIYDHVLVMRREHERRPKVAARVVLRDPLLEARCLWYFVSHA